MSFLKWLKDNQHLVSVVIGIGFVIGDQRDVGQLILTHGAQL